MSSPRASKTSAVRKMSAIERLVDYLLEGQLRIVKAGEVFHHGGFYGSGHTFTGHSWFAKRRSYAAGYALWGADAAASRGQLGCLVDFEVNVDFHLLEMPGNHVERLQEVYGGLWHHSILAKDLAAHISKANLSAIGITISGLDDHLILGFERVLKKINLVDDAATIRGIKG